MKNIFKKTTWILLLLTAFAFASCGKKAEITLFNNDLVSIHTEAQAAALEAGYEKFLEHAFGTKELSAPEPVVFKWNATQGKNALTGKFTFYFADNEAFDNALAIETEEREYSLTNLKIGQTYYWKVEVLTDDGAKVESDVARFTVSDIAPRNLSVDGVTNFRDVGGWKTADGKRVKQGLLYRSARLNDNGKETVTISESGIRTMTEDLKIKTELDLRQNEIRTESALGSGVTYVNIPIPGTITTQLRIHDEAVKTIFSLLADENNYPMFVHCSVGTDRTGLVCFLLNGLLGVSEEDLYTDYAFSNFGKIGSLRKYTEIQEGYVSVIKQFPGETLSEKIAAYLYEVGVTEAQIKEIKRIMTE
ncbi:MAG: tyrosine-protein phosphatase [Lachnospiraceae bacterium]|nr:tyrosine-protein phosphatase [Lachnospiraceae bacterium]